MKQLEILIVGHRGYVGTTLFNYLKKLGHIVEGYDIKDTGKSIHDISYHFMWKDVIIFLAAYPGAEACKNNPQRAVRDNIAAPIITFYNECINTFNEPIFIFTSSLGARDPFQNFYTTTKWIAEQELSRMMAKDSWGLYDIRILRLANIYGGPNYLKMKNSAISKFAKMKTRNEMIKIYGDGSQRRDFIHLYDVCEAIRLCAESPRKHNKPVDIGTGRGISIIKLARMFNHKFTFEENSDMIGTQDSIADTKMANDLWGFKARRKLEDYLKGV